MPKINHTILVWARETAGLTIEDAAKRLHLKDGKKATAEDKLLAYENGEAELSRSMLLNMVRLYRRPLLTFYLDKPPRIGDRGEDFRTLPDQYETEENVYVDVLIRDIKARQSLVRETLIDEDEENRLGFIGKYNVDQGVQHVVQALHQVLNLDLDQFRGLTKYSDAFKRLRQHAEAAGVFILLKGNLGSHHTNIGVNVFRGFALADDIAPFIIINDRDAKSAWCFTLLHEMTHLLLGQTGVSSYYAEKQIEKFCNEVASEFLLPSAEFKEFQLSSGDVAVITKEISRYAFTYKVSSSHVAYRLYRRGDINKAVWEQLRDYYYQQWVMQREKERLKNKGKEGGPDPYVLRQFKLGSLVRLVQRFAYSGALSTTKAGMLLEMKPLKVHRLFNAS